MPIANKHKHRAPGPPVDPAQHQHNLNHSKSLYIKKRDCKPDERPFKTKNSDSNSNELLTNKRSVSGDSAFIKPSLTQKLSDTNSKSANSLDDRAPANINDLPLPSLSTQQKLQHHSHVTSSHLSNNQVRSSSVKLSSELTFDNRKTISQVEDQRVYNPASISRSQTQLVKSRQSKQQDPSQLNINLSSCYTRLSKVLDYRLAEYNTAQKRKRLYKVGLRIFNEDPKEGIQFFIDNYIVDCNPTQIASLLVNTKNYSKSMIGEFLGDRHQLCRDSLKAFCEQLDFTNMPLDEALRKFQSHIRITGEAQKIDRLIEAFAARYTVCNIDTIYGKQFKDPDGIFVLAFGLIMLNTDLHNDNLRSMRCARMTAQEFVNNIKNAESSQTENLDGEIIQEGAGGLSQIDDQFLLDMYERIKNNELKAGDDFTTNVKKIEDSIVGKNKPNLSSTWRRMACYWIGSV